jgi:hypothetical protein
MQRRCKIALPSCSAFARPPSHGAPPSPPPISSWDATDTTKATTNAPAKELDAVVPTRAGGGPAHDRDRSQRRFNPFPPHPASPPGARAWLLRGDWNAAFVVSILTRRRRRVRDFALRCKTRQVLIVSILTRRRRRVRAPASSGPGRGSSGFNPHPASSPGASAEAAADPAAEAAVSILTRRRRRVRGRML